MTSLVAIMSWPEEPGTSHTLQKRHLQQSREVTAASPYENANISVYVFFLYLELPKSRQFLFMWASNGSTGWRTSQSVVTGIWQKANQSSAILIFVLQMFFVFVIRIFFSLLHYLSFKCVTGMTVTAMPQQFCEFSAPNGCEHLTLCWRHCCVHYMCVFPIGGSQSTERRERGACRPRACEFAISAALPQQVYSISPGGRNDHMNRFPGWICHGIGAKAAYF